MLAKLEAVDMWGCAFLECEDQLMAGPIEGPHAARALVPDNEVLEFPIDRFSCLQHLAHVTPVHADEVDCTVSGMSDQIAEGLLKETCELRCGHLAGGHGKLAVLGLAEA